MNPPEAASPPARVLLIEDDPSIRRFIGLALEDEPIELHEAATVAEALAGLRAHGPFRLVMTDLMLPDGNGRQVLQTLVADPALRGSARLAVFSAGVSAETRAELTVLGVDDVLTKPASLDALLDCEHRSLDGPAPGSEPAVEPARQAPSKAPTPAGAAAEDAAIDTYFSGDRPLYRLYRDSCARQFPLDRQAGDAAVAVADLQAMRRLAHSLKTVLRTLGHELDSVLAGRLEQAAAEGRHDEVRAGWEQLARTLDRLACA